MQLRTLALTLACGLVGCAHSDDTTSKDPSTTGATMPGSQPAPEVPRTPAPNGGSTTTSPAGEGIDSPTQPNAQGSTYGAGSSSSMTTTSTGSGYDGVPRAGEHGSATTSTADTTDNASARERAGSAKTPLDQGNSSAELKTTAGIRRAIMADKSLGFDAKNVKVITVGTKVTLRGTVSSEHERTAIDAYAHQSPGVTAVDDQIVIKK